MRIVIIGQAAFGEKTLQALTEMGEEVVGVYTPPDIPGRADPLKELAAQSGIPTFQPEGMRAPEVYDEYIKLKPDLNVMAFVTSIIPESILNYPDLGTIQYHPSLLPKHRGGSAINWAIINGETKTGITIFWTDKGIDAGPILLQKEVEISPDDTVGSLYFGKLFPLGIEALVESVELVEKGTAPRIAQDEPQATYEGLCTEKDSVIDWLQPVNKVYNLIRGTNPQPGAITHLRDKRFKIFDSELVVGDVAGLPGQVIDITEQGFEVASIGGAILVKRVQVEGSPKIAGAELAEQADMKVGDKLGR
ncbi:MAG TPA: methionyl-tRNA formyltransferase [Dehalococcoidia bacterium]|nr:methionyl-tRNA formyltransferase [Dehalococcoidia bacterium]